MWYDRFPHLRFRSNECFESVAALVVVETLLARMKALSRASPASSSHPSPVATR